MRITDSNVILKESHLYAKKEVEKEELNYWVGNRPNQINNQNGNAQVQNIQSSPAVMLDLSYEAISLSEEMLKQKVEMSTEYDEESGLSDKDRTNMKVLKEMLYRLTGKKVKFKVEKMDFRAELSGDIKLNGNGEAPERKGWGLEYFYHKSVHEKEQMSFSSKGTVKTADGREIDFSVKLNMSREFYEKYEMSIKAGDALLDPLVINLDGKGVELTDRNFEFDLDLDGNLDLISFVKEGSGFLAIDKNKNNKIDDGSELFGPKTNDGFEELRAYDEDGDGWIDEDDSAFENIVIWSKDKDGNDKLVGLIEAGVGAIYLGSVDTQYHLNDENNETNGMIKQNGIYLKENGTAGVVHEVDLKV